MHLPGTALTFVATSLLIAAPQLRAEVTLPPVFFDHMVLQREIAAPEQVKKFAATFQPEKAQQLYEKQLAAWQTAADAAKTAGTQPPRKLVLAARPGESSRGKIGQLYEAHKVEGENVRVKFSHLGAGLAPGQGEKVQGFAIAGEDRKFAWADATIDGDSVVLASAPVPKPVAVRYAWAAQIPWANLFNKEGLPAVTFRTDHW